MQYSYYADLIQSLSPQLLDVAPEADRERYAQAFAALGEQGKKRISEKYFIHLLDTELSELSFRHKRFSPRTRYMTSRTEGVPSFTGRGRRTGGLRPHGRRSTSPGLQECSPMRNLRIPKAASPSSGRGLQMAPMARGR
jgi:hypothetical protein